MTFLKAVIVGLFLYSFAFGQALHGVNLTDMDTSVEACNDFYNYANGTWRKENPIPASMPRWSRRWQAGEKAKDRLREILDDVSSKAGAGYTIGSVDQLVSDFYLACNDEALAEKNGMKPIAPLLAEIDKAKSGKDMQRIIAELALDGIAAPFGFGGGQDNHDPANVIGQVYAAGLGLPDRDYYLKPDQRFADAREKYKAHVSKMFTLAGYDDAKAAAASATVFAFETELAKASLDNVALRDPAATDHKMNFFGLTKLTPDFDWDAYYERLGIKQPQDKPVSLNVSEPEFLKEFNKLLTSTPVADWKTYFKWTVINAAAGSLSKPFVDANFAFYNAYLSGATQMKPRATRCAEAADGLLGEAVGKKYVERFFPPEAKARMTELVQNLIKAMHEIIENVDWMSPETKKHALEKLATLKPKIGYPDNGGITAR